MPLLPHHLLKLPHINPALHNSIRERNSRWSGDVGAVVAEAEVEVAGVVDAVKVGAAAYDAVKRCFDVLGSEICWVESV